MALIAAHLNAGHSGGDSVAIGIYSPSSPTSIPPSPILPVLISLMVSVDVNHRVYLLAPSSSHPIWPNGKALRWQAEGPRLDSPSALLSLEKGSDLWTLSYDFVLHS